MGKRKGIILAGGLGTRLSPLTGTLSKQVIPVYDKPMIYYPLSVLMLADINEILVISSNTHMWMIQNAISGIGDIGVKFYFKKQPHPNGIAEAMVIAEDFLAGETSALILGDNIFFGYGLTQTLMQASQKRHGAHIFSYPVHDPERYGVVEVDENNCVLKLEEKPTKYISSLAVTGLYFYDEKAPQLARALKISTRGEFEITDLNRAYLELGQLSVHNFGRGFAWLDAGTPNSLLDASNFISTVQRRQGIKILCPEEIAWNKKWISDNALLELPNARVNTEYADYLRSLLET